MSSDFSPSNGLPSLADLCIAKMQRNVDQIYSLNTNLGDVPAHLFLRILPKAMTFVQLERLIEYNPHLEDSLSTDLSGYYRLIALREFASLRKAIESSDFEEPDDWRYAYLDMKKERDDRLLRVKQRMGETQRAIQMKKEAKRVKSLDIVVPMRKTVTPFWGNSSLPKTNRHIAAVKREMSKQSRPFHSAPAGKLSIVGKLGEGGFPHSFRHMQVEQHPATVKSTSSNSKPTPPKKLAPDATASSGSSKPKVSRNGQFLVAPSFRPTGL